MTDIPFLTLCRGQVPLDLLWEGQKFGPGWWVAGIDFNDTDDISPSLRDSENPITGEGYPATPHEASSHFSPIVRHVVARLLGVEHDIVVTGWVPVPGTTDRWTPTLAHQRHKLTIHLLSGRSRTWWGLPESTIDSIDGRINDFDTPPVDDDGLISTKSRVAMIDLPIPLDDGDDATKLSTSIRIATITEVETEMRREPVTDHEMATIAAKHAAERERRAKGEQ